MTSICLYFQVHQPYRLRRYSFFEKGRSSDYFDDKRNREVMRRVATHCYVPASAILLKTIEALKGKFKVAFSITGTAIEQMKEFAPEALRGFKDLAKTGNVEFLGETYYHSLASLYDRQEFSAQVQMHSELMWQEFQYRPSVFRNTELIYNDEIGQCVAGMNYRGILAEGVDRILGWRSRNVPYRVVGQATRLLLRNYILSDDIAFRFRSNEHDRGMLTADAFARRLRERSAADDVIGLFMDYETFGEHHPESSGIFRFLEELPSLITQDDEFRFVLPSEISKGRGVSEELSFPDATSWADQARDVSAWCGNAMQKGALRMIYELSPKKDVHIALWRKLQTSDHFYYMSTKSADDGSVHAYFSPFESPYDAFISYMNVLRDFRGQLG